MFDSQVVELEKGAAMSAAPRFPLSCSRACPRAILADTHAFGVNDATVAAANPVLLMPLNLETAVGYREHRDKREFHRRLE